MYDWIPRPGVAIVSGMADAQRAVLQSPVVDDWYQVDHGYWRRGEYYRISHRRLWCDGSGPPDFGRFDRLGVGIRPARAGGRAVLIALQTPEFYDRWAGTSQRQWIARAQAHIRARTRRPIVLRHKPIGRYRRQPPLGRALAEAWIVVTHSSAVALEALAMGVPVIVTEPTFCAARLATPFDRLEDPHRPTQDERRELFARIAGHQWTLAEMRSGEAWERLSGLGRRTACAWPGPGGRAEGGDPGQGRAPSVAPALGAVELHRAAG